MWPERTNRPLELANRGHWPDAITSSIAAFDRT
jgi:hypothetical protein